MNKYGKSYENYTKLFNEQKELNNIKKGVRKLTRKQFETVKAIDGYTNKQIIEKQRQWTDKELKQVWKDYLKIRKNLNRGEETVQDNTYWGVKSLESSHADFQAEGIGYHKGIKGVLKDRNAVHFLISHRIATGEDTAEVLADYGY